MEEGYVCLTVTVHVFVIPPNLIVIVAVPSSLLFIEKTILPSFFSPFVIVAIFVSDDLMIASSHKEFIV